MNKNNLVKTVHKIVSFLYVCVLLLPFLILLGGILFLIFDDIGGCLEMGGVWDDDLKICRYDCLKWTKEDGCIPLPDDYEPTGTFEPDTLKMYPIDD